jgi:stage V sporulation protein R
MAKKVKEVSKPIFSGAEWSFEDIQTGLQIVEEIGKGELGLDLYTNQIEIINTEQMLDAYSSIGMPTYYDHWSIGKNFIRDNQMYQKGMRGLAYEMVINSDPCINYLQEDNTMLMQLLVLAHAGVGHNAVFKNNVYFKERTDATWIIDYLVYAKDFIKDCEERYGYDEVEKTIDAAHALRDNGVDRYARPKKLTTHEAKERKDKLERDRQAAVNEIWNTVPVGKKSATISSEKYDNFVERQKLLNLPQENILYFLQKNSPILKDWQREILRIVRKITQYFSVQGPTKVLNEGFASWSHYTILNMMYEKGMIDDGYYLEFITSHCGVVYQPPHDSPNYSGINPYYLGFNIFRDIERMCKEPTKEDEKWFPEIVGTNYLDTLKEAMMHYRDDSFILQYLSPKLIRDMKLFSVYNDSKSEYYKIDKIQNEDGYKRIISDLSHNYDMTNRFPNIQVTDVNLLGDRKLYLHHDIINGKKINRNSARDTLFYIQYLWGYDVELQDIENKKLVYRCGWRDD